jgi:uncharacterized protein YgbK (DUF1537 family)
MQKSALILADDFSGACDAAARAGVGSAYLATPPGPPASFALSTETRHAASDEARRVIRSLGPLLAGRQLYKKIDSTLRGPWVAEVEALLEITDYHQALVCPAFPAQGRTVRRGVLHLNGEPVQRVECPFEVRDAETEEDLARVAAGLCEAILPVGSAGLARYLFAAAAQPALSAKAGPWLVLVGSEHPVSQAQLRALEEAQLSGVLVNTAEFPDSMAGVFATGGETAARFLRSTEAWGLVGLRECLPGVPAGRVLGGRYNDVLMVLKAGGFGGPDTIVRAIQAFR